MRKLIFVMLVFFAVSVWADSYEYDKALLIKDVVKEIKRNSGKAKKETDAPYIYATVTVTNNRQEGAREEALSACKSMLLNQFLGFRY